MILPLTMNKTLQRLTPLPVFMHNHSGVDSYSVTLGIVSLFPYLLGSRFSPAPLRRDNSDIKRVGRTFYSDWFQTRQYDRDCITPGSAYMKCCTVNSWLQEWSSFYLSAAHTFQGVVVRFIPFSLCLAIIIISAQRPSRKPGDRAI